MHSTHSNKVNQTGNCFQNITSKWHMAREIIIQKKIWQCFWKKFQHIQNYNIKLDIAIYNNWHKFEVLIKNRNLTNII